MKIGFSFCWHLTWNHSAMRYDNMPIIQKSLANQITESLLNSIIIIKEALFASCKQVKGAILIERNLYVWLSIHCQLVYQMIFDWRICTSTWTLSQRYKISKRDVLPRLQANWGVSKREWIILTLLSQFYCFLTDPKCLSINTDLRCFDADIACICSR